ncbi:MAG TPA: hypothetical protein VN018_03210 [Brevundimonas sp.]|nr:hypothetical protein [Brevundimonas sp.]
MLVRFAACALAMAFCSQAVAQTPPVPAAQDEPTTLPDVVVSGDDLERLAQTFVEGLAAPARDRGLARWESKLCLGAVNFRSEMAHQLIDHISDVAQEIGVELDEPGCDLRPSGPNVLIVGTDDGRELASALVGQNRRQFRYGYTRSNRGPRALEEFQTSEAAVRWWHISLPYNTETGTVAIRLPGRGPVNWPCRRRWGDRNCDAVNDRLIRSLIIVDLATLPEMSFNQLGDYLAVLTLAQVDPRTDFTPFDTVLNVVEHPGSVEGLTEWDRNYLQALYAGKSQRLDADEQAAALAERMRGGASD